MSMQEKKLITELRQADKRAALGWMKYYEISLIITEANLRIAQLNEDNELSESEQLLIRYIETGDNQWLLAWRKERALDGHEHIDSPDVE